MNRLPIRIKLVLLAGVPVLGALVLAGIIAASRTAELVSRTAAMRLVLDNVDQGLATIRRDGKLDSERSAAFDCLFGRPVDGIGFAEHLGAADETLAQRLKIGWEQVVDAWLPIEVAIEQLPRRRRRRDGA